MPVWDAEIRVDAALATSLIAEQFPWVDVGELTLLGEGWDNTVWLTADDLAFRFPRREIALAGVRREMAVLPWLSTRVPVPVPDAFHAGRPTQRFPWPWFGSRRLAGRELADTGLGEAARAGLAAPLGSFLAQLHRLDPAELPIRLPVDPNARADRARRVPATRSAIDAIAEHWPGAHRADPILAAAAELDPDPDLVLCHGDLHRRHLLISEDGELSGVIDWGDVCLAPRAIDLLLYWSLFRPEQRTGFLATYGPVDADTLLRARTLALSLDALLLAYALDRGIAPLAAAARDGLDRSTDGPLTV